jgi:hypothetical protein
VLYPAELQVQALIFNGLAISASNRHSDLLATCPFSAGQVANFSA